MITGEKLINIMDAASNTYGVNNFGLRFLPLGENVVVGDVLGNSYEQIDDQDDYELDGVSTIGINYDGYDLDDCFGAQLVMMDMYDKNGHLVIVGCVDGDQSYGNDDGEVVMANAVVLHILQ